MGILPAIPRRADVLGRARAVDTRRRKPPGRGGGGQHAGLRQLDARAVGAGEGSVNARDGIGRRGRQARRGANRHRRHVFCGGLHIAEACPAEDVKYIFCRATRTAISGMNQSLR